MSFDVQPGQVVGIVGESGCGKSVTIKSVLQHRAEAGSDRRRPDPVPGNGRPGRPRLTRLDLATGAAEMRAIRGSEIALIPQEPMAAISPVHTIGNQLVEAVRLHQDSAAHRRLDAERGRSPSSSCGRSVSRARGTHDDVSVGAQAACASGS